MFKNHDYLELNGILFVVEFFKYRTGSKGFILNAQQDETQTIYSTLSVEGIDVKDDEFIIKDYRENSGLYNALLSAGFILPYSRRVTIGINFGLVCKLNEKYTHNYESGN